MEAWRSHSGPVTPAGHGRSGGATYLVASSCLQVVPAAGTVVMRTRLRSGAVPASRL